MAKPAEIKTRQNEASVADFINSIKDEQKKNDSEKLAIMMQNLSGEMPRMWGSSIIGFGSKRYKSPATGREVDWFKIGFAPRKNNLSLHLVLNMQDQEKLLAKLGKHKTGAGCLYINKLEDVDTKILEELIGTAMKAK